MKKIFVLFTILILSFGFFACDLEDTISGPKDTWCERSIEVSDVELTCYLLFSEDGYSHKDLNSTNFNGNYIEPGLTIVLTPTYAGDALDNLVYGTYAVKHFALGSQSITNNESDTKPKNFTVGSKLWDMIWLLNSTTFKDNGLRTNPPNILETDGNFNPFSDFEGLSWKDIVIAILEGI